MASKSDIAHAQYKLGDKPARKFKPKSIVYRKFTVRETKVDGKYVQRFEALHAITEPVGADIADFIIKVQDGLVATADHGALPNPLDIAIDQQCYVVIELDRRISWEFTLDFPAVTTKGPYKGKNFGLTHVMDKDPSGPSGNQDGSKCHVVYFGAVKRDKGLGAKLDKNLFNFHVIFTDDQLSQAVEVLIDPDVTNPGGQGVPPHP